MLVKISRELLRHRVNARVCERSVPLDALHPEFVDLGRGLCVGWISIRVSEKKVQKIRTRIQSTLEKNHTFVTKGKPPSDWIETHVMAGRTLTASDASSRTKSLRVQNIIAA